MGKNCKLETRPSEGAGGSVVFYSKAARSFDLREQVRCKASDQKVSHPPTLLRPGNYVDDEQMFDRYSKTVDQADMRM